MEHNNNIQTNNAAIEAKPIDLSITVRLIEPKNNLLGFARVVINDAFLVDDITVVQGKNGIFAGMPSKPIPGKEGEYRETVRPITGEFRAQLNTAVAEAYHAQVEKVQSRAAAHTAHAKTAETKASIPQQLEEGKKWAAKENAKSAKSAPTKGHSDLAPAM